MTDVDLESQIQSLLCGDLEEAQRTDLLIRIATDDEARELLKQMALLQQHSRRAYGFDQAADQVQLSVTKLQHALGPGRGAERGKLGRAGGLRSIIPVVVWAARVAAVVVVAVSVCLAWQSTVDTDKAERTVMDMREEMADLRRAIETPPLLAANLTEYRALWQQVQQAGGDGLPWVMLRDGRGEFGYISASGVSDSGRIQLIRCFVLDDEARTVESIDLLIPAGQNLALALPRAGEIAGRPLGLTLTAEGPSTFLDVSIADPSGEVIGIRGRTPTGDQPVEIGRFQLAGQTLRVVLQLVAVDAAA